MLHLAQSKPQISRTIRFPIANTRNKSVTSNFFFVSAHLPIASSLMPAHVRVLSEYSYIPDRSNLDFPERNTRFEARERKSTLTSFLNLRGVPGSCFQPDSCACAFAKLSPLRNRIRQARKPDLRACNLRSSDGHGSLVKEDSALRQQFHEASNAIHPCHRYVAGPHRCLKTTRPKSTLIGRK